MNTIQATELRIGNFIGMNLEEYPNNFFTALEIGETMKVYEGLITLKGATIKLVETSFMYVDDFEPIPLNEEWLVKFGFENEIIKPSTKHGSYFSKHYNDCKYSFSFAEFRNDWGFYHSYTDAGNEDDNNRFDFISCGIKYVHQLQNLHFALTGTELTLTDK